MIYLDNNATTPLLANVIAAMRPFLEEEYGNPGGIYDMGNRAKVAVERARAAVAKTMGVLPSEITFTGSGTESDNHALIGSALMADESRRRIVISAIEHSAVKNAARFLARFGFEIVPAPIRFRSDGSVDEGPFLELLDEQTAIVSVMHTNNETGVVMPVEPIFQRAREMGIRSHCDAVQSFGKIAVKPAQIGCDLLTLSAHKFHGPKGIACLYTRKGVQIEPLIHGGSQENKRRAGTENVLAIVGMGAAAQEVDLESMERVASLRDQFESTLMREFPGKVAINFRNSPRVPNTSSVQFIGQNANIVLIKLDRQGVCASTGAACHSGSLAVSSVLLAMGLDEQAASATVRFSLSKLTTQTEIDGTIQALKQIIG